MAVHPPPDDTIHITILPPTGGGSGQPPGYGGGGATGTNTGGSGGWNPPGWQGGGATGYFNPFAGSNTGGGSYDPAAQKHYKDEIDAYLVTYLTEHGFPRQHPVAHHAYAHIRQAAYYIHHPRTPHHHDPMARMAVRAMRHLGLIHAATWGSGGQRLGGSHASTSSGEFRKRTGPGVRPYRAGKDVGPGWRVKDGTIDGLPTDAFNAIAHTIHVHSIHPPKSHASKLPKRPDQLSGAHHTKGHHKGGKRVDDLAGFHHDPRPGSGRTKDVLRGTHHSPRHHGSPHQNPKDALKGNRHNRNPRRAIKVNIPPDDLGGAHWVFNRNHGGPATHPPVKEKGGPPPPHPIKIPVQHEPKPKPKPKPGKPPEKGHK